MSRPAARLHPAVRGFDRSARTYERGRPGYPRAAVGHLARELRLGRGRTVVELGAGTGKLTRALLPQGAAVVAVEPTAGMRAVFGAQLPSTLVVEGTAEAIPLPERFADAVVVAQAFHWFRVGPALREIARVLRPDGRLALVWNVRDESFELSRRVSELLDRRDARIAHARDGRWRRAFDRHRAGFGPLHHRAFRHVVPMDRETFVERFLSVSAVAILPSARRRAIGAEIRDLVDGDPSYRRHGRVRLPYRTDVYVARRLGSPA